MKLTKLYLAAISLAATLPTQATEQLAVQASAYLHGKKVFEETKLVDADGAVSFGSVYPFNPRQNDVALCGLGFYSQQALTPLTRIVEVSPPGIHTRISFDLRLRPLTDPDYDYLVELQAGFITERTLATPAMEALFWGNRYTQNRVSIETTYLANTNSKSTQSIRSLTFDLRLIPVTDATALLHL